MKNKEYVCCVTGSLIPSARVKALQFLGISEDEYTIVSASSTKRIKLQTERCSWDTETDNANVGQVLETILTS